MTEKWELGGIDCDEIEANSSLTLDGGFDFNSIWNSDSEIRSEGEIRNVWDLMEDYYSDTKDNSKVKYFLSNMSVFTRWYSYETGINDRFGDYEIVKD